MGCFDVNSYVGFRLLILVLFASDVKRTAPLPREALHVLNLEMR